MTIKISEAVLVQRALEDLKNAKMEGSLSYQLKKLRDILTPIVKNFEETKNELIKKHGELIKEDSYQVSEENMPKFLEELSDVLEQSEEIQFTKIKAEAFSKLEVSGNFFDMISSILED